MDKLERLTNLLLVLLEAPRPLTMRELVDHVEGYPQGDAACRQTFERDKRTLREEGVPLETVTVEEHGQRIQGYRVRPEQYYLPELGLTSEGQAALNLAVAAVRLDTGSSRDALWKLGGAEHDPAPPFAALPALPALPALHEALRNGASVRFRYRGRDRHVDPYGMGFRHGFWYLVGHDRDHAEQRTFRVDRIEGGVEPGEHHAFTVPARFDLAGALPEEPWRMGEGEALRAQVLVDRVRAPLVLAELREDAVAELELAACCGLPPYTPDQLIELIVTDEEVEANLGGRLARPLRFSAAEGFTVAASARAILAVPGADPHGALARALAKLDAALGERQAVTVELDAPALLDVVRRAIADGQRLEVTYYSASRDEVTTRRIDPRAVFSAEGRWYVNAWCNLAGGV